MKPLIAQRWEDGWDKPMQQWRKELNVSNPVIDEPYSLKNRLPGLELAWSNHTLKSQIDNLGIHVGISWSTLAAFRRVLLHEFDSQLTYIVQLHK